MGGGGGGAARHAHWGAASAGRMGPPPLPHVSRGMAWTRSGSAEFDPHGAGGGGGAVARASSGGGEASQTPRAARALRRVPAKEARDVCDIVQVGAGGDLDEGRALNMSHHT